MEIRNSTILITGGTSGIGLEMVKQFTELGAKIIVTGRNLEMLYETQKKCPMVHVLQSDVSNPSDIEQLYTDVIQQFPELNIIVNNAGVMRLIDLEDTSVDLQNLVREIDINLSGTIQMVHRFLPHLIKKDSAAIVNVSSAIAFMAYSSAPIYSASKAGVHAYTKALRLQLQKTNVKVFEVIPPGVNTNLQQDWVLQPNPGQMMDVKKMVHAIARGISKNRTEITPGLSGVVKYMCRIAPDLIEKNLGHREFEKFKQIKRQ